MSCNDLLTTIKNEQETTTTRKNNKFKPFDSLKYEVKIGFFVDNITNINEEDSKDQPHPFRKKILKKKGFMSILRYWGHYLIPVLI